MLVVGLGGGGGCAVLVVGEERDGEELKVSQRGGWLITESVRWLTNQVVTQSLR